MQKQKKKTWTNCAMIQDKKLENLCLLVLLIEITLSQVFKVLHCPHHLSSVEDNGLITIGRLGPVLSSPLSGCNRSTPHFPKLYDY